MIQFVCTLICLFVFLPAADAAVLRVSPGGSGDGSTWTGASSLSNALATANEDDQLWIADGTYADTNTFSVATDNLALYGGFTNGMDSFGERDADAYPVLLDGEGIRRVMTITGTNVTLDGLVITNGYGQNAGASAGGIYATGAGGLMLANCVITDNEPYNAFHMNGGGAYFSGGSVTMSNCTFLGNRASNWHQDGLGFYASGAVVDVIDCLFSENVGNSTLWRHEGGAFRINGGTLTARNSSFEDNSCGLSELNQGGGGAGYIAGNATAAFSNCLFRNNEVFKTSNTESPGGALYIYNTGAAVVALDHCAFVDNTGTWGGAIFLRDGTLEIENCTLRGNHARISGSSAGQGGAVMNSSGDLAIRNSILWDNTAETRGDDISRLGGSAAIRYSCLSGDHTDSAIIYDEPADLSRSAVFTQDPLFASASDLHLKSQAGRWNGASFVTTDTLPYSACIDAGDPSDSVGGEVAAHGDRINLGRYGGTDEASKSPSNAPIVENRTATTNANVAVLRGELVTSTVIADVIVFYSTNPTVTASDASATVYPPQQKLTVFSTTVVGLLYDTDYYYRWFATNSYGTDWANTTGTFHTGIEPPGGGSHVIHVDADAAGGETGDNWFNAFTSLKDAAAAIASGTNEIWVAGGIYDDATVDISVDCSVYGGFDGTETNRSDRDPSSNTALIDGAGVRRCMNITDGNVILDGLVITNGLHSSDGLGLYAGSGVDDLKLFDCTFTHNEPSANHAYGGGAAFVGCPVLVSNCLFDANISATPSTIRYEGGGGFYAEGGADVTVVDCVFTNNGNDHINSRDGWAGGAFYMKGGSLDMSDTIIADNKFYGKGGTDSAHGGGGGRLDGVSPARITRCLFAGNYIWSTSDRDTTGGGILVEGGSSDVTIEHCIFDGNYCANTESQGGAICLNGGTLAVSNSTFVNNYTDYQGGAFHINAGTLTVVNSILWSNNAPTRGHDVSLEPAGSATFSYCRAGGDEGSDWIYDGAAGITTASITTDDPRFAGGSDVHLRSKAGRWDPVTGMFTNDTETSLLIDSGDPAGDFGQEQAPNGGRVNLGRYGNTVEASKTFAVIPVVTNISYTVTNNYVTLLGQLIDNDAVASVGFYYGLSDRTNDIAGWDAFLALPGQFASGSLFSNAVGDLLYDATYYFRAFATNSLGFDFADNVMMFTTDSKPPGGPHGVIHVKAGAPGSQSGVTWFDAFHTVLEAVNKVNGPLSNEIWVASGVVQSGGTLAIGTNVNIYGGFAGTETNRTQRDYSANTSILDGEGVRRVVSITEGTVLLDGLTVVDGHATVGAGIHADGYDGLTLANCQIIDNHHGENGCNGAGAYLSGASVLVTNTTFADNSGNWGGGSTGYGAGISAHSVNLAIIDSVFRSNSLENFVVRDGEGGGGIWMNHGSLSVTDTAFVGNRGNQASVNTRGGGACFLKGALTATFKNCAFVGNVCAAPDDPGRKPAGGALHVAVNNGGYSVTLENCTIGHGSAHGDGGAIIARSGDLIIKNSILWTNEITGSGSGKEIYVTGASTTVSNRYTSFTSTNPPYVVVNSGMVNWGPGIIVTNPLFASATDLHLQSKYKRFDDATQTFVVDEQTSPCIDRGDPADDVGAEPLPNGDRINLGAYGGTWQASLATSDGAGSQLLFR
jgi:hypothetical protein